jgi:uncharacterized membrane protein YfcA
MMEFPISGIETYWWLPTAVAFVISALVAPAGISGAFVLLPFQVSVLGFTAPGVTPTNLLFNIAAIPSGIYRFYRERRMVWALVITIALGTVPGLLAGVFIRIRYLPDPRLFKLFVGLVLLYIVRRLILDIRKPSPTGSIQAAGMTHRFLVIPRSFTIHNITYEFNGESYRVSTIIIFLLSAGIGMVGGIYGIGGGAILAPLLVSVFGLPVYTVSGAALCATFINSTVGVLFYALLGASFAADGASIRPDWLLGLMFGVGGAFGIYVGARIQRYLPARLIKGVLVLIMLFIAGRYILGYL